MLFKVDEGKQYHVRDVEIHGIDPQAERALKSQFGYGRVFDVAPFRNFLEDKSGLPTDVSLDDAIQVRRDLANASVDIVLDFRSCPKMQRDLRPSSSWETPKPPKCVPNMYISRHIVL